MENNPPERTVPVQIGRSSRAFRQFKNPPQPHMCILDTIKDSSEKLYINVLGWQKIANPKQFSDPIPLYGGMQVPQGCGLNSNRPPLLVFAVMVNPDILKANGKNAANSKDPDLDFYLLSTLNTGIRFSYHTEKKGKKLKWGRCGVKWGKKFYSDEARIEGQDRLALVNLMCDFVEAMNPGLVLARKPSILKDRDLAGELKDVWLAVQNKREREKGLTQEQDVMYKVYDIDGIGNEDLNEDNKSNALRDCREPDNASPTKGQNCEKRNVVKSSKQILLNAGQKSEFDSGMNNCQLSQNNLERDHRSGTYNADTTYCTPVYGQIVSSRENHNQINDIQQKLSGGETTKPSTSFRKEWNTVHGKTTEGWDEFSKRNILMIKSDDGDSKSQKNNKTDKTPKQISNGKAPYDFFPVFDNKTAVSEGSENKDKSNSEESSSEKEASIDDNSKIIIDPMQKLVLHATDNKICDSNASALSSISS